MSAASCAPQREDGAARRNPRKVGRKIIVARADFRGQRLVARRQALHGVGDPAIDERQPVVARYGNGPGGVAIRVQHVVEQDARKVAGEGPSACIRAVHAGRKADDDEPRSRIAKGRHRSAEIIRVPGPHGVEEPR
jgi:hypothetical protein